MNESLMKAGDCAEFCAADLRAALGKSSAVEAIVLIPLIAQAAELRHRIDALINARAAPPRKAS